MSTEPEITLDVQRNQLIAQARGLQRQAGRMDQAERAKTGYPPREFRHAARHVGKPGRRGRKAQARLERTAAAHGIEIRRGPA